VKDFFVSYTARDKPWAEWIAWQLERAGYSTAIQAWDFLPGSNFVVEMDKAAAGSERTLAVLSPDYLQSAFGKAEWAAAFADDPTGEKRKLIPVQVRETKLSGLLKPIVHIDLVGLDEAVARERLLSGLAPGRGPATPPPFPVDRRPAFPGPVAPPSEAEAAATLAALPLDAVPEPGPLPPGSAGRGLPGAGHQPARGLGPGPRSSAAGAHKQDGPSELHLARTRPYIRLPAPSLPTHPNTSTSSARILKPPSSNSPRTKGRNDASVDAGRSTTPGSQEPSSWACAAFS